MVQQRHYRRTGFTLIELMVGMAVIAILVALLLPAIQQAREAARRIACRNNLRQMGMAIHNYQTVHGVFPPSKLSAYGYGQPAAGCDSEETGVEDHPGACTEYQSWTTLTLPFLGQSALANQFDNHSPWSDLSNRDEVSTRLSVFLCPSAAGEIRDNYHVIGAAATHYGAVIEVEKLVYTDTFGVPNPGISARVGAFAEHRANRLRDISDGLSQTILVAESAGRPAVYVMQQAINDDMFNAYTGDDIVQTPTGYVAEDGIGWADPDAGVDIKGVRDDGVTMFGPRFINAINTDEAYSFHSGGAQFLFADGSVRMLSETLDGWTYISLCTRAGGEVVGGF